MVFNRSLDFLKLKTSFFAFVASPILTSITFWKQAFKTAALFVQSSLFENLLLKKFSRVIVVYCSIIKVLFAVLFKRQLLYFIKSFSLCQELYYFLLLLVSCSIASLWQLIYVITSELLCQPLFNDSYKLLLISLMNHSIELPLDQGLSVSTPSSLSEVVLWFSVPFSATKIILSRECVIVNVFYIFHAILNILKILVVYLTLFLFNCSGSA